MEKNEVKIQKVKAVKPTKVKDVKKTETKKTEKQADKKEVSNKTLKAKMTNLETAYLAAMSGKMKFGKVKEMFKKFHKELKKTRKK